MTLRAIPVGGLDPWQVQPSRSGRGVEARPSATPGPPSWGLWLGQSPINVKKSDYGNRNARTELYRKNVSHDSWWSRYNCGWAFDATEWKPKGSSEADSYQRVEIVNNHWLLERENYVWDWKISTSSSWNEELSNRNIKHQRDKGPVIFYG